jgi:hypothetical protein
VLGWQAIISKVGIGNKSGMIRTSVRQAMKRSKHLNEGSKQKWEIVLHGGPKTDQLRDPIVNEIKRRLIDGSGKILKDGDITIDWK